MTLLLPSLPLTDSVYIFTILIGVILLAPFLFRLAKIPDVAAFIIIGVIIGPYGFKILSKDAGINLLGTVGLLYIMFLAGLELDPEKLKVNKRHSIIFGAATFAIPFIMGMLVCLLLLQMSMSASILISIMFSTHTLVAYPIVRKLGITKDIAVLTAVGGTIITDTLVLLILSVISGSSHEQKIFLEITRLLVLFGIYLSVIFFTFPKLGRWFFKNIKRDQPVHYLFLLFLVSISSVFAKLLGIEPIIGAFVAGLALNKIIPKNSILMHNVDFVGNILFIPVFLISIGMLINTRLLISGVYLWYISAMLIVIALAGKWIAAYITQKIVGYSVLQRNLLFGLSCSHAAATIAVILIGFEKKMIDETMFNAVIFIILASTLTASFVTAKYGKQMVLHGLIKISKEDFKKERILVPISNPATIPDLALLANTFKSKEAGEQIFILSIINDDGSTKANILNIREVFEKNIEHYNVMNENIKVITRVDLSISSGIVRTAKEYMVSDIIFGWSYRSTTSQKLFGSIFDHLLKSTQTLYACNFIKHLGELGSANVVLPPNIEFEQSFMHIMNKLIMLPLKKGASTVIYFTDHGLLNQFPQLFPKISKLNISLKQYIKIEEVIDQHADSVLNVMFLLRNQSVSYNFAYNHIMQKEIAKKENSNFIIVVPGFE